MRPQQAATARKNNQVRGAGERAWVVKEAEAAPAGAPASAAAVASSVARAFCQSASRA